MLHHSPNCASPTSRGQRLRRPVALLCAVASLVALTACSSVTSRLPSVVTPYKIDILQGNVVTREQIQALKTGMPREQVRDILGSPLLASVFHADRWDYVFTLRRQGQEPQRRRVAVFFKGEALDRFEADELPTEAEFVALMSALNLPKRVQRELGLG